MWAVLRSKINEAKRKNKRLYAPRKKTESRVIIQEMGKFMFTKTYLVTHQVNENEKEMILDEVLKYLPDKSVQLECGRSILNSRHNKNNDESGYEPEMNPSG